MWYRYMIFYFDFHARLIYRYKIKRGIWIMNSVLTSGLLDGLAPATDGGSFGLAAPGLAGFKRGNGTGLCLPEQRVDICLGWM